MEIELLGNTDNPKMLVIGCFHGDEPQGDYLIRKYFEYNPNSKLLLLPCFNKTGFKAGTRVNKNGVDLNRNFPTKNWVKSDKNEYYGGGEPSSEEETTALIKIINKYMPDAIISLHAPYKIVNYDGDGKELAEKIAEIIKYPVSDDIGYPTPGSFGTWAGIENNIPVITLELAEDIDVTELEKPVFKIFKMLEKY